jgi:hypothetical protein
MNPNSTHLPLMPGPNDGLLPLLPPRSVTGRHLRACFPVVSNRAFIRAWAVRRARVSAAALAAKSLAK